MRLLFLLAIFPASLIAQSAFLKNPDLVWAVELEQDWVADKAQTKTWVEVKTWINSKQYQIGRKATSIFTANIHDFVQFDQDLPQWNYSLLKQNRELVS